MKHNRKWILLILILVIIGMNQNKKTTEIMYEPMEDAIYIRGEQDYNMLQSTASIGCMPLNFNVIYIGNKISDNEFNNLVNTFDSYVSVSSNNLLDANIVKKQYLKRDSALSNDEIINLLKTTNADGGIVFSEYFNAHLGMPFTIAPYDAWLINAEESTNNVYLSNVAIHEIGHGIGFRHNNDVNDVMCKDRNRFITPRFNQCSLNYIEHSYLTDVCYDNKLGVLSDWNGIKICNVEGTTYTDPIEDEKPIVKSENKISNQTIILGIFGFMMFMMFWMM